MRVEADEMHAAAAQITAVTLVPEAFSVENGLLTPTFKLKRPQAKAAFQDALQRMYAATGALPAGA